MKKLFFSAILMLGLVSFSTQLQAQTPACTPAQMEACKKICGEAAAAKCTPAQKAACQKVCSKAEGTKAATTDKKSNVKLVNNFMDTYSGNAKAKTAGCAKNTKMANNTAPSCSTAKSKVAVTEQKSEAPIAQKVAQTTNGSKE